MPNIKSAIKRVNVTVKKNEENKSIKSRINTYIRKFKLALNENKLDEANTLLNQIFSFLDTAAKDNVIHANNASRKKAHLANLLSRAK